MTERPDTADPPALDPVELGSTPLIEWPAALARLYQATTPGDERALVVGTVTRTSGRLSDLVVGAGFSVVGDVGPRVVRVRRERSLPDTVGPGLRLVVCGLNPSLYAADAGVGFARPGNRFWPAALEAGIAGVARDPWHAWAHHGLGMTDLVKRATRRADEVTPEEYQAGVGRVERLVAWLAPGAVCMVGFDGWRRGRRRGAVAGWQSDALGGRPTYLMPSTSGLNAHATVASLAHHLALAAAGPP